MGERELDEKAALGAADVEHRLVAGEGKLLGDRDRGARAQARHRVQELAQPLRVGVERGEEVAAGARLVLWFARAQRLGQ